MAPKQATAYGFGRVFNAGPSQTPGKRSDDLSERLMLLESATTLPIIPPSLLGNLPSLRKSVFLRVRHSELTWTTQIGGYHLERRVPRIGALRHVKCVYSNEPSRKGHWLVVNTDRFLAVSTPGSPSSPLPSSLLASPPALGFAPTFGANEGYAINAIRIPDPVLANVINAAHGGGYKLDHAIVSKWTEMESNFLALASMLKKPLDHLPTLGEPPLPSSHNYTSVFETYQLAFESVRQARNAFSNWTTFLSFLLSFWRYADAVYPFAVLLHHCKLHLPSQYAFLHELVHSTNVGDFRLTTRAGYIVDLVNSPSAWIPFLHILAEAGVPMWIYGGANPRQSSKSALSPSPHVEQAIRDWLPCFSRITAVFSSYAERASASLSAPSLTEERSVGDEKGVLYGLSHFGFRDGDYDPGMHPGYYFPLRESAVHRWLVNRTRPSDAVQRSQVDTSQWIPLFNGRSVYVWERERGSWMRRKIIPPLRRAWFETFEPSCRRWCPILREIDLCSWLGEPPQIPTSPASRTPFSAPPRRPAPYRPSHPSQSLQSSTMNARSVNFTQSPLRTLDISPDNSTYSDSDDYDSDWEDSGDQSQPAPAIAFDPSALRSLSDILLIRLGYDATYPLPPSHVQLATSTFARGEKADAMALRCLGHAKTKDLDDDLIEAAVDASQSILTIGREVGTATKTYNRAQLPARWDISPLRRAVPSIPHGLVIRRLSTTNKSGDALPRCALGIVGKPIEDQWWLLVVEPSALLQIFRSGVTGILQAGRYLIQNGIPFNTAFVSSMSDAPVPRPIIRTGLGALTSESPFSQVDYAAYEWKKKEFLQTRRGALALKCGGIIWRLAIESVNSGLVKEALTRPSQKAERVGTLCGKSPAGVKFVDDALEDHELDIILGAYRSRTRKSDKIREWSDEHCVYIWPTPAAWSRSGLNTGEWSSDAEEWYQYQINLHRKCDFKLRSSSGWKQALKIQSETRGMWKKYDDAVREVLFD